MVSSDTSILRKADPKGRSALLADIQQGTRLRKVTQINDRSAPQIETSKGTNKEGGGAPNSRGASTPPALGDLFAGGFPVLRPAGQRDAAASKGTNKEGGGAPNSRGASTPPALGDLFAGGFPVLRPAGQRDAAGANSSSENPPPLPPKSPSFQAPSQKAGMQTLPTPPAPPGIQPLLQKKRPGRGPGTSGAKLNPPPAPPARSPTTELSSKSQQVQAWSPTQQPGGQLRNGNLHIIDDFESKFTFHSVEDFPPPDEYKPCQKIYPSKIPRTSVQAAPYTSSSTKASFASANLHFLLMTVHRKYNVRQCRPGRGVKTLQTHPETAASSFHSVDNTRMDLIIPGEQYFYLKARSVAERQRWLVALGSAKACLTDSRTQKEKGKYRLSSEFAENTENLKTKMSELRLYCDLLVQQVDKTKEVTTTGVSNSEEGIDVGTLLKSTCNTFLKTLEECMQIANAAFTSELLYRTPPGSPQLAMLKSSKKVNQKYITNKEEFTTLQKIVLHEVEADVARVRNSATEALLWLKRGLKFLKGFLTEVKNGEKDIQTALNNAYGKTLRQHHGWVVRGVFALALRAAPSYEDFVAALTIKEGDHQKEAFSLGMQRDLSLYLPAMEKQLAILDTLYEVHGLESDEVV
ncbi:Pleckstrin homology domain-containing family A member 8 [Tupaia chinensis]|uniref:Pleckstrin homology domain-containing family A member 8 n=1 Tax=Tupaia chinensis TaxID=246437 RepID=L9KYZ2_TUPCH|nr:Pleckstrin homology domain-containing family A member 8 [Tupaia chinensis]